MYGPPPPHGPCNLQAPLHFLSPPNLLLARPQHFPGTQILPAPIRLRGETVLLAGHPVSRPKASRNHPRPLHPTHYSPGYRRAGKTLVDKPAYHTT